MPMNKTDYYTALKKDFKNFLYLIWHYLNLPAPTKRQYEVADYLQHSESKRRIIEAYRGFGKSWITSAYVLWKLFKNPNEKILVLSASRDRAQNFTNFTQKLIITIPELRFMVPPAYMRWSSTSFDINGALPSHAPSVKASGIFSQITGARASEIVLDDVETINTVETETMRNKLYTTLSEIENIVVPEGYITYLGTPHSMDSIYGPNKLLSRGYDAFIVPARYPKIEDLHHYHGKLSPFILQELMENPELEGQPTDRYTEEELTMREYTGGRANFLMQYMLDTFETDERKYPLQLKNFIVMDTDKIKAPVSIKHSLKDEHKLSAYTNLGIAGDDGLYMPSRVDEEWLKYDGIYMAIDPAGKGVDQTAYVVIGQLNGNLYILDLGGLEGGYDDNTLTILAQKAKEYNVTRIYIEANFGDGMFTKLFQPILLRFHQCVVEEVKQFTQKEKRIIDTLEPVLSQHRLVIDTEVINREYNLYLRNDLYVYSLLYQMTNLCDMKDALKHDDKVDVLAIGVKAWQQALGLDTEKVLEEYKEQQLMELLKRRSEFVSVFDKKNTYAPKDERTLFLNF